MEKEKIKTCRIPGDLREYGVSVYTLLKWLMISIGIGLIVGSASSLFGHVLIFANKLREQYPFIIYTLPIGGILIVALYRGCRNTSDKGTNTVVASIQESADIPFKMAPLILFLRRLHSCVAAAQAETRHCCLAAALLDFRRSLWRLAVWQVCSAA